MLGMEMGNGNAEYHRSKMCSSDIERLAMQEEEMWKGKSDSAQACIC